MNSAPLVLHVPFGYFPSPVGGTEVYVAALCRELRGWGITSIIAAPGLEDSHYLHDATNVFRFAVSPSFAPFQGGGDPMAAKGFGKLLDQLKPQIVHFHAQSPAVSVLALREARQRGIATVYTYHTPTGSCHRGTLMRWGIQPCDGRLTAMRCAACQLHHLGVPKLVSQALAMTSWATHSLARWFPQKACWQIPLRASKLADKRHRSIQEWWAGMDRIVALCDWTERLLRFNGVPHPKVSKVRHGLTQEVSRPLLTKRHSQIDGITKLVFLGRLDPNKGVHLLLDALDQAPGLEIQIDFYTLLESEPGPYVRELLDRLNREPRTKVCQPAKASEVISVLTHYDALLVPSQWMETGPLVVLEAFASGIPVIGSHLGGIAEWVTHERDGLLVSDNTADGWAKAMRRLVEEPGLLSHLASGVKPPRDMRAVAGEMMAVYQELMTEHNATRELPR